MIIKKKGNLGVLEIEKFLIRVNSFLISEWFIQNNRTGNRASLDQDSSSRENVSAVAG
jgi:hypothetical protein